MCYIKIWDFIFRGNVIVLKIGIRKVERLKISVI